MNEIQQYDSDGAIARAAAYGDVSGLSDSQKAMYQKAVSESVGLNPLTSGFQFTRLQGKEVLYASKQTAEQLRKIHGVSIASLETKMMGDLYVVTVTAQAKDGRTDTSTAALDISGLKGERLANALMKAETKAKRRVTLSICGLGMLDESEVESTQQAAPLQAQPEPMKPKREGPFYYSFSSVADDDERRSIQEHIKKRYGARPDRELGLWVTIEEAEPYSHYEVPAPGGKDEN